MKILKLNVLRGANVFSYRPVMWLKLSLGQYVDTPSSAIDGFVDQLLEKVPSLKEHHCSVGHRGGFVERLKEGTYLAHIFEHVLLELQNICGDQVRYGKTRVSDEQGIYDVVVTYKTETVAKKCAYLVEKFLNALIAGENFDLDTQIRKLKELHYELQLGPSAAAIAEAAKMRKIPVSRFVDEDLLILGQGKHVKRIWSTVTEKTSLLATDLVANKYLTTKFLAEHGVNVPCNFIVTSEEEAVEAWRELGASAVLKPLTGSHGRGVTVNVNQENAIRQAFQVARAYDHQVLLEYYIMGRQYRFCMVDNELVAAAERIPAYVIGDGAHTIAELVEIANAHPFRGEGHGKPLTKINLDAISLLVLEAQKLAPNIVPEAKRIVKIKETANISTGGTAVDVTALVHPENVALAQRIAQMIGLDIMGIDIIANDISKPLNGKNGAVIEINAAPGIRMHHYPSAGQARDVGGKIIEYLFPYGSDGRIPILAVTGTNGKTTVTRMLSAIFQQAGFNVGMTTTEGVYFNQECQMAGDCSGPLSAKMVLHDEKVEVAVLETARGGIVKGGLGFDRCDVGIVTNISEDHLGQDGIETLEDLVYIKSLVLELADVCGTAVINADDVFAPKLAARVQAQIVYFSMTENNIVIRRHLGTGGKAVFMKQDKIYLACGNQATVILNAKDIPVTLGGAAKHNVQNALAAIAASFGYGVDVEYIQKGLTNFVDNVGRLNLFPINDFTVCVDYGHNFAGYQAIINTVRKLGTKRLVGVIGVPGDRRNDVIFNIGKTAGAGFDQIYIKEDRDLRGREVGETASILEEGVIAAGFPKEKIKTILAEEEAIQVALENAIAGDFIVVFYEHYHETIETIQAFMKKQTEGQAPGNPLADFMVPKETANRLLKNSFI
ncbi:MAG: cphA [Firmicutes bacterium]|nr:cphA [Bacillota bacterium]